MFKRRRLNELPANWEPDDMEDEDASEPDVLWEEDDEIWERREREREAERLALRRAFYPTEGEILADNHDYRRMEEGRRQFINQPVLSPFSSASQPVPIDLLTPTPIPSARPNTQIVPVISATQIVPTATASVTQTLPADFITPEHKSPEELDNLTSQFIARQIEARNKILALNTRPLSEKFKKKRILDDERLYVSKADQMTKIRPHGKVKQLKDYTDDEGNDVDPNEPFGIIYNYKQKRYTKDSGKQSWYHNRFRLPLPQTKPWSHIRNNKMGSVAGAMNVEAPAVAAGGLKDYTPWQETGMWKFKPRNPDKDLYKKRVRMQYQRGTREGIARYGLAKRFATEEQYRNRVMDGFTGMGAYRRRAKRRRPIKHLRRLRRYRRRVGRNRKYGRGGYWGQRIGGWLGGLVGQSDAGAKIGDKAGDWLQSALGLGMYQRGDGAYEPVTNDLIGPGSDPEVPTFGPMSDDKSIVIQHREYIRDITGYDVASTPLGFKIENLIINPGLQESFPWLSQVAANFEEYQLLQCIISYKSTVADFAAASGQVGTIAMATKYNMDQEPYEDEKSMMESNAPSSGKTSMHQQHGIECDIGKQANATRGGKYIRTAALTSKKQDPTEYDHCQTSILVTGLPATYSNQKLGQLWISYTVVLKKPRFWAARANNLLEDIYQFSLDQNVLINPTVPYAQDSQPFYVNNGTNGIGNKNPQCLLNGQANSNITRMYSTNVYIPGLTVLNGGNNEMPAGLPNLDPYSPNNISQQKPYAFALVLDSSLSLDLEIQVILQPLTNSSVGIETLYDCFTSGNIVGVQDMYQNQNGALSAGRWTAVQYPITNINPTYDTTTLTAIYHIRVKPTANGIQNALFFWKSGSAAAFKVVNATCRIAAYNTQFNAKQNGLNDALLLETPMELQIDL